jgi:excisionase family DNA binding protein
MPIRDLATHNARFVTIAELARYWAVSRQQIYKRIESGALEAIQLGSRLYRVRTSAALDYEHRARVRVRHDVAKLPQVIGVQRVLQKSGKQPIVSPNVQLRPLRNV